MRAFLLDGETVSDEAQDFGRRLALAYRNRSRPICLCANPGIPMYIAMISDQPTIKRMPLTGGEHHSACPSYEPPYELSGLGALMGHAIKLDGDGRAALRLNFSLSKRGSGASTPAGTETLESVRNDSRKLSLRGLLHFFWHEGGLTEWTARWAGKRHWRQVHSHLVEAARTMSVRGESLAERVFLPEPFRADDKTAIEKRRALALAPLFEDKPGAKPLMILVGEIKELAPVRTGQQVVIKHMPGFRLYLEEATWRRLQRRFETELMLWQSADDAHLIVIATIGGNSSGIVMAHELALMTVTEQWLPVESIYEQRLLGVLTRKREKTVKGLRFDLPRARPYATAILPERPQPLALYIVPPGADSHFEAGLKEMVEARPDLAAWIWHVGTDEMPDIAD
ncbi:hypothetical protein ATY81_21940 [Rhizobium sp. R72]|uniref:DUF1173 domain-containing protein n=1 Tax=unclassified Rhizobium TaxID=2613769 RepID=UPI000B53755F|nr:MULTISPECIES: DUF1173 domain-containing protein [unclassified Rhizobium]OWW02316.1 hypothetical protein ATY81_21940 [Rhizobium sp. R72]OWW02450.1 hypothetical protein ATY80_21940 [Rhizobium sp. R711]